MRVFKKLFTLIAFVCSKWFKRKCPHFCALCAFKGKGCLDDFKNGNW